MSTQTNFSSAGGLDGAPPQNQAQDSLDAQAVRLQAERILSSAGFRASDRLKRFFRFLIEETLEGRGALLKEYIIGVDVFDRGQSFDPRLDTIVRVEARKLRARVAEYYHNDGGDDPILIEFEKGTYAPVFRHNVATRPLLSEAASGMASVAVASATPAIAPGKLIRPSYLFLAGSAIVLLLLAGGFFYFRNSFRATGSNNAHSIAVLPFANDGADHEGDIFGDGLTDEVIESLGQVPGLQVVARTSAFQFKGKSLDIRDVGRKLNVRNVLEGSIRKSGNRLRITAELADTQNGYRIWSKTYDRELHDSLTIQHELAQAIAVALGVELANKTVGIQNARTASTFEGYNDYLKGRYFLHKRTPENINTAMGYFRQAIEKSPEYALAYTGLADCYASLPIFSASSGFDVISEIRSAAQKALDLDRTLAEAHLDLAVAYEYDFEWRSADREFKTALQLSPGSAEVHQVYAGYLSKIGRPADGVAERKIAFDLDPVSPEAAQGLARSMYWLRHYDGAVAQYQRALSLDPNFGLSHQGLGSTYIQKGRYEEGLKELTRALGLMENGPFANAELGYGYALAGDTPAAKNILNQLIRQSQTHPLPPVAFAPIYIGLGDKDSAFAALRKSIDRHDVNLQLTSDPIYDSLRADPRFSELLRRMSLPFIQNQ